MTSDNGIQGLKVGIVGGSISGCVTAAELLRIGCDVTVFERSRGNLEDRGAGILLALSLIETLKERDLINQDMPYIEDTVRPFIVRYDEDSPHLGRNIWEQPVSFGATNWDVLYRELRKRVPDSIYQQGADVVSLNEDDDRNVTLKLADGNDHRFDLLICADGYFSVGRDHLFPKQEPEYAGYILWRGLIDENLVPDMQPFEGGLITPVYEGGHAVCYIVPGPNGELEPGERRLNWATYENVADKDLPGVLTDANGVVHRISLPPGAASESQVAYVHNLARTHFPGFAADAICVTTEPFIQAINDMRVPYYHSGRICLIGDASTLARPHTGAGSVKAMTDAIALSSALTTNDSVDDALQAWDNAQSVAGNNLVNLGRSLGEAMVTDVPDWKTMNTASMEQWFATVMSGQKWYAVDEA